MSDPKQPITLMQAAPWFAIAVLGYMLLTKQDAAPGPAPDPKPVVVTIEKATSGVFLETKAEVKRLWNEAADMVESKDIKTDAELFAFIKPASRTALEQATKTFDDALETNLPRNSDGSFLGKEIEAGKVLRKVARSW